MAKEFDVLKEQANVIKNEVEDGANTASRVGGMFEDIVDRMQFGVTEVNVSQLYPTGGTDGSNKYTLETAIAKVGEELRHAGLKVTFLNAEGKTETWEFQGGTFTDAASWRKRCAVEVVQGLGDGENAVVSQKAVTEEFKERPLLDAFSFLGTDVSSFEELLNLVPTEKRKGHCILLYRIGGSSPIISVYQSRFVDDELWLNQSNWHNIAFSSEFNNRLFRGVYSTNDRDDKFETGVYWSNIGGYILCVQESTNPEETGVVRQTELGNLSNYQGVLIRSRTYDPNTSKWGNWKDFGELLNGFNKNVTNIVTDIVTDITNSLFINYPLIDVDNLLDGYVSTGTGKHRVDEEAMQNYPNSKCTPKIPVVGGMEYIISGINGYGCGGYDKDGNLVPPIEGSDTYSIIIGRNKIASNVVAVQFTVNLDKEYDVYKNASIKPVIGNNNIAYSGALATAVIPILLGLMEQKKVEYPNAIVRKTSATEINVYMKIHSIYYGRFKIIRLLNEGINADYWRLANAYLCSYNGEDFVQLHNLLLGNENEYVFSIEGASDSTGSFHGDEKFTDVYFLIDNKKYSPDNIPSSIECRNVEYREVSSMYGNAAGDESIVATHYKITTFKNCGYTTRNRVTFAKDLALNTAYGGLVCVHKDVGKYWTADDNVVREATGSGEDTRVFNKVIHPVVRYWNDTTGLSCTVDSHILYGMDNDLFYLSIWDRGNSENDTKYYHRGKVKVTANQDYMTECNVIFDYINQGIETIQNFV